MCVNGAAARLVQKDDKIIVVAYCQIPAEEAHPTLVVFGEGNAILRAA
jgi:aspartate 1-decarboxylase